MRDIILSETGLPKTDTQSIWNSLTSEVDGLIAQGEEECRRRKRECAARGLRGVKVPEIPLIRLRVEHSGFETVGNQSFGQQFIHRVANPDDVLLFHKKKMTADAGGRKRDTAIGDILEIEEASGVTEDGTKIQDIIYRYLEGTQSLQLLSEPDLNDAVQKFVHRAEPCAIEQFVRESVEGTSAAVLSESGVVGEDEIRVQIQERTERLRQQRLSGAEAPPGGMSSGPATKPPPAVEDSLMRDDRFKREVVDIQDDVKTPMMMDETCDLPSQSARGRARGRGRGRGKAAKRPLGNDPIIDADIMPTPRNPRNVAARAAGFGTPAPLRGQSVQGQFFQSAGMNAGGSIAGAVEGRAGAEVEIAAPGPAGPTMEAVAPTTFLPKRGGLTDAFARDSPGDLPDSLFNRPSQPATKRQWALRDRKSVV